MIRDVETRDDAEAIEAGEGRDPSGLSRAKRTSDVDSNPQSSFSEEENDEEAETTKE